ncbi:MAG: HAMP domain-containing histidine kinase [Firmicutes bacterium]|nr:HAMP domain-containing histidine kinase [Bacillota bacterium]
MKTETEKTVKQEKGRSVSTLRGRLATSFIIFAVLLMALLWIFQAVFLDRYYELSMSRRCSKAVSSVCDYYASGGPDISYDSFMTFLGEKTEANDIYFWIESTDGTFNISSSEVQTVRIRANTRQLIAQARNMLKQSGQEEVSFTARGPMDGGKDYIYARYVESEDRNPVYIYAIATLTPMGPAVGILRSQLLIVTAIALIVGIVVARFTAKRLARPISDMEKKARELAKGNYDVYFEGGDYKEISDLAETLNQAAADLKASDALQKDLIANVSHDLRTPLTMIKSYAELIRDISGDDPKKREEHLEVIINETDRLDELVGDILTLSKMQAGVMEMEMTDFDIQEAGESVLSTYKVMENEGFTISFRPVPGPVMVHGDRHRIQQVIANLLSNAVRYSKDRKDVALSFSRSGGRIVCSVEDKGIGIAEEDLEKIWNRYQKASKQGARSSQGTGLGLSIASEILQKHGAEYGVESKPGEGSRFWFSLPVNK